MTSYELRKKSSSPFQSDLAVSVSGSHSADVAKILQASATCLNLGLKCVGMCYLR